MNTCSTANCTGVVSQRGTILCDACLDQKKSASVLKRQQENETLLQTLKDLQKEYEVSKLSYQTDIKLLTNKLESYETEILRNV